MFIEKFPYFNLKCFDIKGFQVKVTFLSKYQIQDSAKDTVSEKLRRSSLSERTYGSHTLDSENFCGHQEYQMRMLLN